MEIPRFDTEFLFSTGLAAGLGSNDIGLDRGAGRRGRVVTFQRVGPRVLLVQRNQSFRSSSPNAAERKSVEDSFAKSVLWGFTVAAESERPRPGRRDRFLPARRDTAPRARCGPAPTASTARAARSICRARRRFPKNTEIDIDADVRQRSGRRRGGGGAGPRRARRPIGDGGRRRRRRSRRRPVLGQRRQRHADGRLGDAAGARVASSNCPTTTTSRATTIRAPATAACSSSITASPIGEPMAERYIRRHRLEKEGSVGGDERAGQADSVLGRSRRARGRARRRCSKARAGGTRRSRPPASATRSRSTCCPTAPIRWTSATT